MSLTDDEIGLLELATEDYSELFTADWGFRYYSPNSPDVELKQRAQEAIRALVAQGLIALYRCSAWIGGTETPVPPEEVEAVLADSANWETPPADDVEYICFAATDKGKEVYRTSEEVRVYFRRPERSNHGWRKTKGKTE